MARLPLVCDHHLHLLDEAGQPLPPLPLDSDAWWNWLATGTHRSFSFKHALGHFTVRCEHQRHGWYWYAYHRRDGRLHKTYLGRSEALTLQRLHEAAATLAARAQAHDRANASAPPGTPVEPHQSAPTDPAPHAPSRPLVADPLPVPLTPLLGRTQEVAAVCAQLQQAEVRLLTLTGTGGVGKTRLALQIAHMLHRSFADGVHFVNLAPLNDSTLVMRAIAQALRLKVPEDRPALELLQQVLHRRTLLLLLDNFEQLLPADPSLVHLLQSCPRLKLLVTSRVLLRVQGEQQYVVPPLRVPPLERAQNHPFEQIAQYEAVALFVQRARTIDPTFQVNQANAYTLTHICTRLDGLPLALELAAARLKLMSPQVLLTRLDSRLQLLTGGPQDAPVRQQTLRNTIAWSYSLLRPHEQRLFRVLSIFVGGCTLEAVEAVCADWEPGPPSVLDAMDALIDSHLLVRVGVEGAEPRFVLLETVREYGLEQVQSHGEWEALRHAHAAYYLALAEQAEWHLVGPQQIQWYERLHQEQHNLRLLMHWLLEGIEQPESDEQRSTMALRLTGALWRFWGLRGPLNEARDFAERVLAHSPPVMTLVRAKALYTASVLALYQKDWPQAHTFCSESLTVSRALNDKRGIAIALYRLCMISDNTKEHFMEDALALFQEVGDLLGTGEASHRLGDIQAYRGRYEQALTLYAKGLALYRKVGHTLGILYVLISQLELQVDRNQLAEATKLVPECLSIARELNDRMALSCIWYATGLMAVFQGDYPTALTASRECTHVLEEAGEWNSNVYPLILQAKVAAAQSQYTQARTLYEQSLVIVRAVDDRVRIATCLEGLAEVVAAQGQCVEAAQLWGTAEALRERIEEPLPPLERSNYDCACKAVQHTLGTKAFTAAWNRGRVTPVEQMLNPNGTLRSPLPDAPPALPVTSSSPTIRLTKRQKAVLRLAAEGLSDQDIAEKLVLSRYTVSTHLHHIYNALGVNSRMEAANVARKHDLI